MELSFKLDAFEGPLDLLLHLIEKNKVSIWDIPIALITDQYLDYVREMQQADLDVMSEFLVMAATLIELKCRMLLPPEKNEEGEEVDPREDLVRRLLEYKLMKEMSLEMRRFEENAQGVWYREPDIPKEVAQYRPKADPEELLSCVTLGELHAVFLDVMKRREDRIDPIRSTFGRIEQESVEASEVMREVMTHVAKSRRCTFRSLLSRHRERMYVVVTLLTILELMRLGRVDAVQEDNFGEIQITVKDGGSWDEQEIGAEWMD